MDFFLFIQYFFSVSFPETHENMRFQKKIEKYKKKSKKVLTKIDSHGSIYKLSRETANTKKHSGP
jgi:hypothetical protein